MIYRLTDFIKNSINNFLSQELSPDEIEEMRLSEGLRLEDVKVEEPVDVRELFEPADEVDFYDPFLGDFNHADPIHWCLRAYDFDFRNPWNDD